MQQSNCACGESFSLQAAAAAAESHWSQRLRFELPRFLRILLLKVGLTHLIDITAAAAANVSEEADELPIMIS